MFYVHVDKSVCVNEWVLTSGVLMCILRNSSRNLPFIAMDDWLIAPVNHPAPVCSGLPLSSAVVVKPVEDPIHKFWSETSYPGAPGKDTSSKVVVKWQLGFFCVLEDFFPLCNGLYVYTQTFIVCHLFFILTSFSLPNVWFQFMFEVLFTETSVFTQIFVSVSWIYRQ